MQPIRLLGLLVIAATAVMAAPATSNAQGLRAPSQVYWSCLGDYHDGAFRTAVADFLGEAQSGSIKAGSVRWLDSLCYHTMAGESYFQLGNYAAALDQYTIALNLFIQHSDWMIRVQFEPNLMPATAGNAVARVPWGQSKREFRLGQFKDYTLSAQGSLNQMPILQRGGIIQNPMLVPLATQEVVRCTCQAMRRRRDILGPICAFDPLTSQLLEVCSRRAGQPNHWSECYVDLQLGMAFSAAGKDAQAKTALERSLVAGGMYDHPLTGMAMVELARIALIQADYVAAERWYEEATYSAVNFDDWTVLEDAFRYGTMTHLMANRKGMYPLLVPAAEWARRQGLGYLQVSLLELCAESAATVGQAKVADNYIKQARTTIGRSDINVSRLGARVNYIGALASYEGGQAAAGDASLTTAMNFQRGGGSLWLFQILYVDTLLKNQTWVSARVAMDLYTLLLRDPTPADWLTEPIEALSVMATPHTLSYESWFDVAIGRREFERALEISDLAKRHRFLSALDFGGRLLNLRWLLEGAENLLDQRARLQKQDILSKFVAYEQLARKSREMYDELRAKPMWYEETAQLRHQAEKLGELAKVSAQQETILREIALRREPADILFPKNRNLADVRGAMGDGQALLAFFCTSRQTHVFLMTRDNYGYWALSQPTLIERQVKNFLRELGNWEQNKQLRPSDLADAGWKKTGRDLLDAIMKDSKITLPYTFNELIIVPDNLFWYLPFEALEVSDGQGTVPLLSKLKIRYTPTVGMGMNDTRPHRQGGNTAVVLGKLFPQDDPAATTTAYEEMERSLINPTAVHGHMHAPSGIFASLADRLIVLADIVPNESDFLSWSPIPLDHNAPGSTLAAWMPLPWASPEVVILPGYHSAAENSLKKQGSGNDLFMAITGIMATGARTVLISRWRPGGQSSYDLVREFAQELPHETAEDAWRRSVFLSWERPLNPTLEPRLVSTGLDKPPTGEHPFFWSAFLLADTGAPPKMSDDSSPDAPGLPAPPAMPLVPAAVPEVPKAAVLGNQGANSP